MFGIKECSGVVAGIVVGGLRTIEISAGGKFVVRLSFFLPKRARLIESADGVRDVV